MNIAFYAPMKPPEHPRPSGDRQIARWLIRALENAGHQTEVVSDFRAWEGKGEQLRQLQICRQADDIARQLISRFKASEQRQRPQLWFSYHLYHKAPDWIGPTVARALKIPYVVAEASYAAKQANGPWATGLHQVRHAIQCADAIFCLNPRDVTGLKQIPETAGKIHLLPPFLDCATIPELKHRKQARQEFSWRYALDPELPWLICVAMMRKDAKLNSYRYLAKTMRNIKSPFQAILVGDGLARPEVEALFSGFKNGLVSFTGQLDQASTYHALQLSDLFVWPAVNEAIGMAILEAQACAVPVIAGNSGAIPEIVEHEKTGLLCEPHDSVAMAKNIEQLLNDAQRRTDFAAAAIEKTDKHHCIEAAGKTINRVLLDIAH